jgi:hypothetical protein
MSPILEFGFEAVAWSCRLLGRIRQGPDGDGKFSPAAAAASSPGITNIDPAHCQNRFDLCSGQA